MAKLKKEQACFSKNDPPKILREKFCALFAT